MAEKNSYERYGMTGNPFRDLASVTLENIDQFHVNQLIDDDLNEMRRDVTELENKAIIVLLGNLGTGKTERTLIIKEDAEKNNHLCVNRNITNETKWVVKGIADEIIEEIKKAKKASLFAPSWLKDLKKISKKAETNYDPEEFGQIIARALNENTPSYLILNDFHGLEGSNDVDLFMKTMHSICDSIDKGVMVLITSHCDYFNQLLEKEPSLKTRINRFFTIPPLTDSEASMMLAKRMIVKRVVVEMDPLYPFSEKAIAILNRRAAGNPRELLRLADQVIDYGIKHRSIQINEFVASLALGMELEEIDPVA
jgi:type II secretory pathway predicted ATPase ExeA